MAKGVKTGGRDIKKGQVLNPDGRPVVPADLRKARVMNRNEFTRITNELLEKSGDELNAILIDKNTTSLKLIVCKIIVMAVTKGDYQRLNFLLDRIIGPVPKALAVAIEPPSPNQGQSRVIMLPRNGREKQPERVMGEPEEIEVVDVEDIT